MYDYTIIIFNEKYYIITNLPWNSDFEQVGETILPTRDI